MIDESIDRYSWTRVLLDHIKSDWIPPWYSPWWQHCAVKRRIPSHNIRIPCTESQAQFRHSSSRLGRWFGGVGRLSVFFNYGRSPVDNGGVNFDYSMARTVTAGHIDSFIIKIGISRGDSWYNRYLIHLTRYNGDMTCEMSTNMQHSFRRSTHV